MKIVLLGTAAACGWPNTFCDCDFCGKVRAAGGKNIRTRASMHIDDAYKIDLPPDSFCQALRQGVCFRSIRHLLITHADTDHFYPEDLYLRAWTDSDVPPLTLYGSETARSVLFDTLETRRRLAPVDVEAVLNLTFVTVSPHERYDAEGLEFIPIVANHASEQWIYGEPQEMSLNYVLSKGDKTVLVAWDTGWYPQETWEKLSEFRFDMVAMDCTILAEVDEKFTGQNTLDTMVAARRKLEEMGCLKDGAAFIATHFSSQSHMLAHDDLVEILGRDGIEPAYDGMTLEV